MMWIDPETMEVAKTFSDMRSLRPNWSGPLIMTEEDATELGFLPVKQTTQEYDPIIFNCKEGTPELVDGEWVQKWDVSLASAEEVAERKAVKEAADKAEIATYLIEVREFREKLLNRLALIAVAAVVGGDTPTVEAILSSRVRLLNITKPPGYESATTKAEYEDKVKAEYASIVGSVPASLRNAFKEIAE